ncbi:opioid growth factor receptor-like [Labeo rohita]|uniref:opioid growth factor receptor-like n=1 Tax=Labeo rohita TaxID=84645 RepID=UPI0021E29CBD|nr:opioid growth factor receptor-like [Labeo rohita]
MCVRKLLRTLFFGLLRCFRSLRRRLLSKLRLKNTRQINMSDNECDYDSTWEDEHENKTPKKKKFFKMSQRNTYAARDMQNFRHSCRGLDDDDDDDDDDGNNDDGEGHFYNLEFYRGQINSSPDNVYIDDFHKEWLHDYTKLEDVHSYIQWLFPIQEPGVNWRAHVLKKKEIKLFRNDEKVKKKLVKSYKLMLDFYGIHLVDQSTGEVARASNWEQRFRHLNRHTHNNLRITRILKCLGTLGLEHYQAPLVRFFLHETLENGNLPNVKHSVLDYFMFAVLDKLERRELVKYAFKHFKPQKHFVWGPKKILSAQVVHYKKEKVDQPTESKQSRTPEDQQKRVNSTESTHEMNKIDASHPPDGMQSKKDLQNKDEAVIPNKLTEINAVGCSHQAEEGSPCQVSDTEKKNETEDKDKQKIVNLNENKNEMKKTDANYNHEEMKSEEDDQNMCETVTSNSLIVTKSDQGANECSECRPENESVEKINPEMSVGVGVGNGHENIAPTNNSHGYDAISDTHQAEEGSPCQGSDAETKNETEDKDKQETVNLNENKNETKKIDANYNPEEMKSEEDDQNMRETVTSNNLTETKSDQGANESSQCRPENESVEKINPEMSVGVGDGDGNENIAPANNSHGYDSICGAHQAEEGSPCQVSDTEMKNETEDKDKQEMVNLNENKNKMKKIDANYNPEEMEGEENDQNMCETVTSNNLTETKSDQGANESSQCRPENESVEKINPEMSVGVGNGDGNENIAPANNSHGYDSICGSHQAKEGPPCQGSDEETMDVTEDGQSEESMIY